MTRLPAPIDRSDRRRGAVVAPFVGIVAGGLLSVILWGLIAAFVFVVR